MMTQNILNAGFSRRTLLVAGAASFVTACARQSSTGWNGYSDAVIIDGLGGFGDPNLGRGASLAEGTNARALADLRQSGVSAQNFTLPYVAGPEEPYQVSIDAIDEMDVLIAANSEHLTKILTASDIRAAKNSGRSGVIYGFQNAEQLGEDTARVDDFFQRGVRIIQLTYNIANTLGHGSMVPENGGLTEFGRAAVEAMNVAGIVVDLSHSGEQTCLDALAVSNAPILLSHTGCRAISDLPRNKTDAELRLTAESGGIVGIYFMPFLREDGQARAVDVVRHVEHAINVCGEDHVAFGSDGSTSTVDDMESYRVAVREEMAERRRMGISATGERDDVVPFIPDMRGPELYREFASHLKARGHSDARIEKIMGGNLLRLFNEVWPG
jgi:membrane dipeptidase